MSFEFEGELESAELVPLPPDPGPSPRETALAVRVLELESEEELEGFLPFLIGPALAGLKALAAPALKAAGSAIAKAAVPALKSIGGKLLSRLGGNVTGRVGRMAARHGARAVGAAAKNVLRRNQAAAAHRTRRQQALQLASRRRVEGEAASGPLLGNAAGGSFSDREGELEQLLEASAGSLFGEQELEGFLGGIIGSLFGELGEMTEAEAEFEAALWFVRLADDAAMRAAGALSRHMSAGKRVAPSTIRAMVRSAIMSSGQRILPAAGIRGELEGEQEISKPDLATLRALANEIARKMGHRAGARGSTTGKHERGIARKAQDILNSALRAIRNGTNPKSEIARLRSWGERLGELEMEWELEGEGEMEGEGAMHLDTAIDRLSSGEAGVYTLSRRDGRKLLSFSVGKSENLRRRLVQHKNLIERLCGDSRDVLVTFKKTAPGANLSAEERKRRDARVKAQGGVRTRDRRELELELQLAAQ
ncbi:hypothetical protein [Sorangium sp. So ce385]|uniref:hypothetical protein n=1 Tax=Sorangium sp. So ce385 TaxID=3133308 RepID=UPI003F5BEF0F